ncbi:MAG TPA: ABC transporter permease [Acidimicrobiales bacterium]|nr:ABC transporter permease [Acidimicrobiales bacterium]
MSGAETIVHLVLGLGPGAVYGALGCGLVITFRGSGIINLAYGTLAMYPTYVYAELRRSGDLVLPGVPGTLHLADHVGLGPALTIALAVGAVLGLCTFAVIARPHVRGSPLATVVSAVGVMITLQAVVALRFGTDPRTVGPILPQHTVDVGGRSLPTDRLYLVGLIAVVVIAATIVDRWTRFGLASRGAAESAVAAELLGFSPVRLAATNWVIGAVLATLFGILLAPIAGLAPSAYSLLVVPALVAALAGRLTSPSITVVAGLALGVVQSQASRVRPPWEWLGPQTIRTVLPFLALLLVLMAVGTPLPPRGAVSSIRLPAAPVPRRPRHQVAILLAGGAVAAAALGGGYRSALVVTMIGSILCLSLVILTGFTGQISLAQMSFAGIAGFVLSHVTVEWGLPFPVGSLVAAVVAALSGLVVGLMAQRARGMTLAILTLGAALVVEELVFRNLSNGILASNSVPPARLPGVDLAATGDDGAPQIGFVLLVLAVLAGLSAAVLRLRVSGLGRRLLAVRSDERAAAANGVSVGRTKLIAFALSGFVAGLAGTLAGYHQGVLSDQSFSIGRSLVVLAVAYLGGIGGVAGAVVGGLVIPGGLVQTAADRIFDLGRYQTLFAGLAVVVVAMRNPEGLSSSKVRTWRGAGRA